MPQNDQLDEAIQNTIEEITEQIIEEKWNDLVDIMNKVIEWKNDAEERLVKLEQKTEDVKNSFQTLEKSVVDKVGEYDDNVMEVGTDIKALEKAFQKIIPQFTEDVHELRRVVKHLKDMGKLDIELDDEKSKESNNKKEDIFN
ncbi:MAG: hypothetical protein ACOCRX_00190 [Candidatus Woesearchaeota archaeon]